MVIAERTKSVKLILCVALAVVVVLAAVLFFTLVTQDRQKQDLPPELQSQLSVPATPLVEQKFTADWLDGASGQRVACAVKPLGTEPASVDSIIEVQTVYVWSRCATVGTPVRSEASQPVAVRLTDPVRVDSPQLGDEAAQLRRIFPARLQDAVTDPTQSEGMEAALEARIREIS